MFTFIQAGRGLRALMVLHDAQGWESGSDGAVMLSLPDGDALIVSGDELRAGVDSLAADLLREAEQYELPDHPAAPRAVREWTRSMAEMAIDDETIAEHGQVSRESLSHLLAGFLTPNAGRALAAARPLRSYTCAECGAAFESREPNPRYCSARCRMRAWRKRQRAHQAGAEPVNRDG